MTPSSAGRLTARPVPPTGDPWSPGLHELGVPGALLAVPHEHVGALLVFLHGAGGTAHGSLPLVREAAADAGVAGLLTSSTGQTWDLLSGRPGPDVFALDAALEEVLARLPVDRLAIGGFSDGGSYALSLGLANGDLFQAVLAFSPGIAAPPSQEGTFRVWVSHGTGDTVLPVDRCGRRVVATLSRAGYDVTYEEFDGGHVVPPHLVRAALGWWRG